MTVNPLTIREPSASVAPWKPWADFICQTMWASEHPPEIHLLWCFLWLRSILDFQAKLLQEAGQWLFCDQRIYSGQPDWKPGLDSWARPPAMPLVICYMAGTRQQTELRVQLSADVWWRDLRPCSSYVWAIVTLGQFAASAGWDCKHGPLSLPTSCPPGQQGPVSPGSGQGLTTEHTGRCSILLPTRECQKDSTQPCLFP